MPFSQPPRRPSFADASDARRRNMAAIRGKDTKPEMIVRRLLHRLGYRYRLHAANLPGRPDLVFAARRKAIEIRGCFWHRHAGCLKAATPATRAEFWQAKFTATVERDLRNEAALVSLGWSLLVVWECEVTGPAIVERLVDFLGPRKSAELC